jgi:DNA repair protein RadC
LARCGVDALGAEEVIALILQGGEHGQGGLATARRLASDFGSISRLGKAEPEELTALSGLSPQQAAAIVAAFRLPRFATYDVAPSRLSSAADVAAVAMNELKGATRERTIVLVCDAANHLRRVVRVSEGSIDRAFAPVREILNTVLRHDGRAFAVAHNHPSGDPSPGAEDIRATDKLSEAAAVVGLRFLDHVVVAGDEWRLIKTDRQTRC